MMDTLYTHAEVLSLIVGRANALQHDAALVRDDMANSLRKHINRLQALVGALEVLERMAPSRGESAT